jgi:hypothetical protein
MDRVDISSIEADGENSHDFPSELAGKSLPYCWFGQVAATIVGLSLDGHVVELLSIGLIDGSQVS